MQRGRHVNQQLNARGYTVMRFWEHELNEHLNTCVNQVMLYIEAAKVAEIPQADD
ncbi:DUF559 domain-containing protein [Pedobacter suwonensis]|uniref:DUF559 domain-containing protein n=1 Tax=Pedobacter suwonensis TaxID=332999 RepID=UPI0037FA5D76